MKGVIMKRIISLLLSLASILSPALAQSGVPQKPPTETPADDVVRITTELVQTDVVVMDKNDHVIPDLRLEDFEVYESGHKQELKFVEYISSEAPLTAESTKGTAKIAPGIDSSVARDLAAKDIRRVIAFVVDDVTIPSEDMVRARQMLSDFVANKMQDGDLVAIVRTVGGKGLLEQFTTDRQILRRAIAQLGVRSIPPYLSFTGDETGRISAPPSPLADATATQTVTSNNEFQAPGEGTNQIPRALLALSVSNVVVDSLRLIPGRKTLVLVSGGLPLFQVTNSNVMIGDIGQLFRMLTDNATRSGVVINTMDVRGLRATGVVAPFVDTPGKSALGGGTFAGGDVSTVGRGYDVALLGERSLTEQLSLRALAGNTGGVSVINSNNFSEGLDRVLNRSKGYYRLAYKPSEKFDNKFHKVEVKLHRRGAHVYAGEGYFAREDRAATANTKEEQIMAAAKSPLAKRDLDVAAELQYTFTANNQAQLNIETVIDAHKLNFTHTPEGKYHASFDVVGFVFDQFGHLRGGPSQTIIADLTEADYQRALATGIGYTASTLTPPGYYQVRLVVREVDTGNIGTVSRYFEVPDLSNKQLAMSSILLYEKDPTVTTKSPLQLSATRVISRKQDLRYASVVYNARQATSRLIISQGNKMLFQEAEQPLQTAGSGPGQFLRVGQLALAKVVPGHYVLTLVITDPQADKKHQTVWRSVDFTVVN
jgi:VWFA-related protein